MSCWDSSDVFDLWESSSESSSYEGGAIWTTNPCSETCDCYYDYIKFNLKNLDDLQGWDKNVYLICSYYYRGCYIEDILPSELVKMIVLYSKLSVCFQSMTNILRQGVTLINNSNNQIIQFTKQKFKNTSMAFISKLAIKVSQEFSVQIGAKTIGFFVGVVSQNNLKKWTQKVNGKHIYDMNSLSDVPIIDHYLGGSYLLYNYNRSLYEIYSDPYHNCDDYSRLDRHLKKNDKIRLQVNHRGNFVTYYQNNDRIISIRHFSPLINYYVSTPFFFAMSFFCLEFENDFVRFSVG